MVGGTTVVAQKKQQNRKVNIQNDSKKIILKAGKIKFC